jgi:hypothetical protein
MARRHQAGLVAATLLASGCNLLLGLDPTDRAPIDAPVELDGPPPPIDALVPDAIGIDANQVVGHDEDGDGVDDGLDVCPGVFDAAQGDGDEDGVGDACDPNVNDKTDRLLFFDGFGSDAGHWTGQRGSWVVIDDSLQQLDTSVASGLAAADYELVTHPAITVVVAGSVISQQAYNGTDTSAPRGTGVWFVADSGSPVAEPDGYLCQAQGDLATSTTTIAILRQIAGFATTLDSEAFSQLVPVGKARRIEASVPGGPGFQLCQVNLGDDAPIVSILSSSDNTYSSGGVGLRTTHVHARFDWIMILGRTP